MYTLDDDTIARIRAEARDRGLAAIARSLGMKRDTLASVVAGVAREATVMLCGVRWAEYQARNSPETLPPVP